MSFHSRTFSRSRPATSSAGASAPPQAASLPARPISSHEPPVIRIPAIDKLEGAVRTADGGRPRERTLTPSSSFDNGTVSGGTSASSTPRTGTAKRETLFSITTKEDVHWRRLEPPAEVASAHQQEGGGQQQRGVVAGLDSPRSLIGFARGSGQGGHSSPARFFSRDGATPSPQQSQQQAAFRGDHRVTITVGDEKAEERRWGGAADGARGGLGDGVTAVPQGKPRRRKTTPSRRRGVWAWRTWRPWMVEIVALLFSATCFVGIILLLSHFDSRSTTPLSILTILPFLLAFLSTLCEVSLLLPASSAIGQSKWLWLHLPLSPFGRDASSTHTHGDRDLLDLQAFDDASRGMLGSLRLLFGNSWRVWGSPAALAALVTLGAWIAVPTALLAFEYQAAEGSAAVPTSAPGFGLTSSVPSASASVGAATIPALRAIVPGASLDIEAAVLSAATTPASSSVPAVPSTAACATGNCAFPAFRSLGMCVRAADISGLLSVRALGSTGPADWTAWPTPGSTSGSTGPGAPTAGQPSYNVTFPDGEWFVAPTRYVLVSGASTQTAAGSDVLGGKPAPDESAVFARVNVAWSEAATAGGNVTAAMPWRFAGVQLVFYACVQGFGGNDSIVASVVPVAASPAGGGAGVTFSCGRRDDDNFGHHYPQACNAAATASSSLALRPTSPLSDASSPSAPASYTADFPVLASLAQFLLQFFPGYAAAAGDAMAYADTGDTQMGRLFRAAYPSVAVAGGSSLTVPPVGDAAKDVVANNAAAASPAMGRMANVAQNMATSLSNALRASAPASAVDVIRGTALLPGQAGAEGGASNSGGSGPVSPTAISGTVPPLQIHVRWGWLSILAGQLVVGLCALVWVALATAYEPNPYGRPYAGAAGGLYSLELGQRGEDLENEDGEDGRHGGMAVVKNSALALVFALKRRGMSHTVDGQPGVWLRGKSEMEREVRERGLRVGMVDGGVVVVAAGLGVVGAVPGGQGDLAARKMRG